MAGVRTAHRIVHRLAFAAAAGGAALCGTAALAQDGSSLRGSVTEAQTARELFAATRSGATRSDAASAAAPAEPARARAPAYVPFSPGPADPAPPNAADSLFDRDTAADGTPLPSRSPSTAADRRRDRVGAAGAEPTPPEVAANAPDATDPLDGTATGTVPAGTVDSEETLRLDRRAEKQAAIERLDRTAEDDPFAPLGIRAGTFILRPSLETGLTWTSNADYGPQSSPSLLAETTLRLSAASDWSRHAATIDAYGNFRRSVSGEPVSETRAGLDAALRLDLADDYAALATAGYAIGPESASSPTAVTGTLERPIRQTLKASVGIEKDVGKLVLRLTARGEREIYGDAALSGGGTVSQEDRNYTLGALVLRGGYRISPALTPFLELEAGRRRYDLAVDSNGYDRSSSRTGARAGLALDLGEKLTGEIAAGWIREALDDDRLAPVSAATLDAALAWSPMRGTTVNLTGSTTVEGATAAGESGSVLYALGGSVERQLRANLSGSIGVGASYRDYVGADGRDVTLSAELGLTYWINRYAGLTGRARHEVQSSTIPGRGYTVDSVFLGLKLQR